MPFMNSKGFFVDVLHLPGAGLARPRLEPTPFYFFKDPDSDPNPKDPKFSDSPDLICLVSLMGLKKSLKIYFYNNHHGKKFKIYLKKRFKE